MTAEPRARRVAADGAHLEVTDTGDGAPACVLLHYFAGSGEAWGAVAARLSATYRCLAPDLRGHGRSDAPPRGYAVADGASDVAAVIAAAGVRDHVLVGHSMGGKLALALAARRPPGLRALVLVAPSPPTPEPIAADERARLLAGHGDVRVAESVVDRVVARPLAPALRARAVADQLRTATPAWQAWLEWGSREDVSALAHDVAVPTLVVVGAEDRTIPAALLTREVVPRIRGARMVELPGAGHLLPLEAPAELAAVICGHIAGSLARDDD